MKDRKSYLQLGNGLKVSLDEALNFFCDSSLMAYAGGGEYAPSTEMPGVKVFSRYEHEKPIAGSMVYSDGYISNKTGQWSSGFTTLAVLGEDLKPTPFWGMSYDGAAPERSKKPIMLVKSALVKAYEAREFVGGRGPARYPEEGASPDGLVYINRVREAGSFQYGFEGIEVVQRGEDPTRLFFHEYRGRMLVSVYQE